jgi:hypothetical protein
MKHFLARHGMAYQLGWIEQFILERLPEYIRDNVELTEEVLARCGQELDDDVETIKLRMRRDAIHLSGEGYDATPYVQLYKEALMQLAGLRYASGAYEQNSPAPRMAVLIQLTFQAVENLLLFLETGFAQFFDLGSRVPEVYLEVVSRKAALAADTFTDRFSELAPDPKLFGIAMLPFRQLANSRGQDVPYRKISHLRHLEQELSTLLKSATSDTIDEELSTLLHRINFNFAEFYDYCTGDILRQLAGTDGSVEKKDGILTDFKLYLEGILVRTEFTFVTGYPPLRHSLLEWIQSRRTEVERSPPVDAKAGAQTSGKPKIPRSKMIQIMLSANETGYFIRLLIRARLVDKGHYPELVEVFHANFVSIEGEEMEPKNLRKKGYPDSVGMRLMKKMRDILKRMLAIIEDDIANGKE